MKNYNTALITGGCQRIGFSIVKYIGNGNAAQTVPHHLGTTPAVVIVKNLDATVDGWQVYHKNLTKDLLSVIQNLVISISFSTKIILKPLTEWF